MMDARAPRNWVVVASAEHVRRGVAGGFMQVCHGKATPLRRVHAGDRVTYYSPTATFRGTDRIQSFTAIGTVRSGEIYHVDMGGGFCPARRDVDWLHARPAAIRPLLERLHFTAGKTNWGQQFRYGLFAIDDADWRTILDAMADRAAVA